MLAFVFADDQDEKGNDDSKTNQIVKTERIKFIHYTLTLDSDHRQKRYQRRRKSAHKLINNRKILIMLKDLTIIPRKDMIDEPIQSQDENDRIHE